MHEVLIIRYGLVLYLPVLAGVPAVLGYLAAGGLPRSLAFTPIRLFCLFSFWMVCVVPFSSWPGGSFPVLSGYFRTQWIFLLFVSGLVYTYRDLRWIFYAVGLAGAFNILTAQFMAKEGESRLELESIVTLGNSNDLAAQLLMIAPILWAVSAMSNLPRILRLSALGVIVYSLLICLRTGSRGALVAMGIGYVFILLRGRGLQRAVLGISVPVIFIALIAITPGSVVDRLSTLTNDSDMSSEASQSRLGRTELMKKAFNTTLRHPVFGVGPGQFANSEGGEAISRGARGYWMQAHNTYLQISSEAGIPAILIFFIAIIAAYLMVAKVRKRAIFMRHKQLEIVSFSLMLSIVMFSAASFFLSFAYRLYFPFLVGVCTATYTAAMNELRDPAPGNTPAAPR